MPLNLEEYYERTDFCITNCYGGYFFYQKFEKGEFTPVSWEELTDEMFVILSFDLDISDNKISKMFKVPVSKIRKRRFDLELPRGNERFLKWLASGRKIVKLEDFIKEISI